MKNYYYFSFLLILMASSFPATFAEGSACEADCDQNYSTTQAEFKKCLEKCAGQDKITPVTTDSSNEDIKDIRNPENSPNRHRN